MQKSSFLRLIPLLFLFCVAGNAYGSENLDATFGDGGLVITDFGIADDQARALAVQEDGKIVVAGYSSNSAVKDIAVVRYLPDGGLDPDFNDGGTLSFNISDGNATVQSLSIAADGRIIIAGAFDTALGRADTNGFVVRLNNDGSSDNTFGENGRFILSFEGLSCGLNDLQVLDDGRYAVAGIVIDGSGEKAMVAIVNGNGGLDRSFGEDGSVILGFDYPTAAKALEILPEGLLLGGYSVKDGLKAASIYKIRTDGTLDPSFGLDGELRITSDGSETDLGDMERGSDGLTTFVGTARNDSYSEVLLGRLNDAGLMDNGFGTAGIVRNDLGAEAIGYSLVIDESGSILVAGSVLAGNGRDAILLRYGVQGAEQEQAGMSAFSGKALAVPLIVRLADLAARAMTGTAMAADGESGDPSSATDEIGSYIAEAASVFDDESLAVARLVDGSVLLAGYADNGTDSDFMLMQFSPAAVESLASAGQATGAETNDNFSITTTSVTAITRNSAMSGGTIRERTYKTSCQEDCVDSCDGSADPNCLETCGSQCSDGLTVTARGVVYGTARHPVYRAASEGGSGSDGATTTDTTTDSGTDSSILPDVAFEQSYNYKTVHYGQTSDGTGTGSYGSQILNITPNTRYFVRAYAVLADDTVIYGNELTFETTDACFIATAAYGSILDSHVVQLRQFRDRFLRDSEPGQLAIRLYYRFSPDLAQIIEDHPGLKPVVRIALLPFVGLSYLMLNYGVGSAVLIAVLTTLSVVGVFIAFQSQGKFRTRS
jgi:uncharacterized delta-60 repeat protein